MMMMMMMMMTVPMIGLMDGRGSRCSKCLLCLPPPLLSFFLFVFATQTLFRSVEIVCSVSLDRRIKGNPSLSPPVGCRETGPGVVVVVVLEVMEMMFGEKVFPRKGAPFLSEKFGKVFNNTARVWGLAKKLEKSARQKKTINQINWVRAEKELRVTRRRNQSIGD